MNDTKKLSVHTRLRSGGYRSVSDSNQTTLRRRDDVPTTPSDPRVEVVFVPRLRFVLLHLRPLLLRVTYNHHGVRMLRLVRRLRRSRGRRSHGGYFYSCRDTDVINLKSSSCCCHGPPNY